ncbi:MAG: GTPase [Methanomassiliicoccales archaeon]|nr:MAG: GTPase [Methanomassiliicoccales archaeon]
MNRTKVLIMGAAGRDFHNFNTCFREDRRYEVVAFTASQIPGIERRRYPPELAGEMYPNGIDIYPEEDLFKLIKKNRVEQVVFAYSDISHLDLMHKASMVMAAGADFRIMANAGTFLEADVPVISICAVRTGAGKSQTTRRICSWLRSRGIRTVAIRHPMPYGPLTKERAVQRFASYEDLDEQRCTIEEREEYEPLIDSGSVVYAGIDYGAVLKEAQKEADIIVWDGGNNDLPFLRSDLHVVVADPLRAGHELTYHPGEANVRMADVVLINKVADENRAKVEEIRRNVASINPRAAMVEAASPIAAESCSLVTDRRVLVVEDGPTVTHGGMSYGAGTIAARDYCSGKVIDPRPYAIGSIKDTYEKYPHLGHILPAMGYSEPQVKELEETINRADCDVVVTGTPIDLNRILKVNKPIVRVRYELQYLTNPTLEEIIEERLGPLLFDCGDGACTLR